MSKRLLRLAAALAALVMLALTTAAANATPGLWSATTTGTTGPDACGSFSLDSNNFCFDLGVGESSVELGVRFTSSKAVNIVGARVYRIDSGAVTGSLWGADGTRLAGPVGFSGSSTNSWQDVSFGAPVAITPGQTYVASYHTPNPSYAFQHYFFTGNNSYTVGPITALASQASGGNGVFNYCSPDCFPSSTYEDSNYWVTPLWAYKFSGFYQPVDNQPAWNSVNAGSGVPVKFSLGGDQGLDVLKSGYPKTTPVACPGSNAVVDAIETTTTSNSGLTYSASADQYTYVWKTSKSSAGKCYRFELALNDDTSHVFDVALR
jgi:hypothetical protein